MVLPIVSSPAIDPADFVDEIDNPYLPLDPGSLWIYRGEDSLDIVLVTQHTREILGVEATVVFDVAFAEGEVAQVTLDWFAQDEDGNVWYFGENTRELENGRVVSSEGSWEAGIDGAEPGIVMQAHPTVGLTYNQEDAPGIAEDKATVLSLNAVVDVPFGSFDDALKTHEFTPLDPALQETKYHAKGLGHILTVDELTGEREELVWYKEGDDRDGWADDDRGFAAESSGAGLIHLWHLGL